MAISKRNLENPKFEGSNPSRTVYSVHFLALIFLQFILSFSLIFEYQESIVGGLLFTFAISVHLLVADNIMVENYQDMHGRNGRYIATVIPALGLLLAIIFPEQILEAYILLAFISGAILYQAIRDEIPTVTRKRSLILFLTGAFGYALLLLAYQLGPSMV
jgi:hypothetical protein